jgi:hypothetical protein
MISDDGDRYSANLVFRNFNLVFHISLIKLRNMFYETLKTY